MPEFLRKFLRNFQENKKIMLAYFFRKIKNLDNHKNIYYTMRKPKIVYLLFSPPFLICYYFEKNWYKTMLCSLMFVKIMIIF